MNVIEVLEAARARVAKGWCQEAYAQRADGTRCPPWHPKAAAWCMDGAVRVTVEDRNGYDTLPGALIDGAYAALTKTLQVRERHVWNDTPGRTQAQVLEAFDKAIALARSAQ